ncbi:hypothetical protein GCM10009037_17400 [Halarchaeum grantii]|uniref:ATP-binding protein n=1 Tax=Halarchaeum grantii TaxID=1193105 RepID=A0A830F2J4_9EURY|nr:ATP-binding protein [Halarchaeum grantii]GGL34310.1 hypothetical protein GCM10009037_17400 [Halarchaeum grantii]
MATDTDIPVLAAGARTYIRVRPTDETLTVETMTAQWRRLHQFLADDTHATPPTLEVLLVSEAEGELDYYVGLTTDDADSVEPILRSLFPDTYEFERQTKAATWLEGIHQTHGTPTVVEYLAQGDRPKDWQLGLTDYETFVADEHARVPLAAIVDALTTSATPALYQVLVRPKPDWTHAAEDRVAALEHTQDTALDQVMGALLGTSDDVERIPRADQTRLDRLQTRETQTSFEIAARAAVFGTDSRRVLRDLRTAFGDIGGPNYRVHPRDRHGTAADGALEMIASGVFPTRRLRERLLNRTTSPVLVANQHEIANFTVLDGRALTSAGVRSLDTTPREQTTLTRPSSERLEPYRGDGLAIGRLLDEDGVPEQEALVLPPALQPMHVAWLGKTGSGKSTSLTNAILANHDATDGVDILIDRKGDGMAEAYMRAHYARYGSLENVYYFDCAQTLPAFSFFDIRDELNAGVSHTTAVEDTVDHYIEILTQIMGRERFEQAVRSPDIIRYLTKAAFDPVNGADAFTHRDLLERVRQMHERQSAPAVSDPDLERMLGGVVANRARSFDEIMQGVANRMEKIPLDRRLARVFNHVPGEDDPHLDLADYLDRNAVIIFDTGGLRTEAQRVLTLVILSNLWTALRRRANRTDGELALVNLYIEEAASVAVSDLLQTLLSQARSFGCSITLAMQFPGQLKSEDEGAYEEVLNNVSTIITGNVAVDHLLAERLATDDMPPRDVGTRLRSLRRGHWFVSLPAGFADAEPRPFLVASLPLPPGDPAGRYPLSPARERTLQQQIRAVEYRTLDGIGLRLTSPSVARHDDPADDPIETLTRVDSALPHTRRLPDTLEYDAKTHAIRCQSCDNRYDPDIHGVRRAIECCSSLTEVDRDDIPVCDVNLKLTPAEREISEWSDRQLMFLQVVYNAQQLRYDPLEYDILRDSMIRLQEYVGIDSDELTGLLDADLLRHDTDHPHRLYTVSPAGRDAIGESYREGVDYGHGQGDLEESSEHVLGVEVARQYLEREYATNPDSTVTTVVPYYDLDENRRLDLTGLDAAGDIVVTVEVERINHDVRRAVPDDYDKMAACNPEEAIWVVMTQSAGHDVLHALNDPLEGPVRVEKTYAPTTPPQQFRIDTPGLTAIYPAEWLRATYLDAESDGTS